MSRTHVPLDQIRDNPHQARLDVGDVEGLAETILEHGLRQLPEGRLMVEGEQPPSFSGYTHTESGEWYVDDHRAATVQLASGHRRVEAVRLLNADDTVTDADLRAAGLRPEYVPVDLQRLSDEEMLDLLTVENAQREELSPIEQARLIGELAEAGRSGEEIADRFGKSPSWVSNRKRLLELPTYVQEHVHEGDLSVRQGQALVRAFQIEAENEDLVEKLGSGAGFLPGQMVTAARNGDLDSDGIREATAELEEAIEMVRRAEIGAEETEEEYPELPDGWEWAPDENSDYDYRAVRRYDEWKANGTDIWLVATGDTAERAIDQAIHFDTYFVDHDPSEQLVEDGEVIMGLPYEWIWVACSAKVDGIPVYTPYHFVDGSVDDPGEVRKWAAGKGPEDKAEQAWKMHRNSHESSEQTDDDRRAEQDVGAGDEGDAAGAREEADPSPRRDYAGADGAAGPDQGHREERGRTKGQTDRRPSTVSEDMTDETSGDGAPGDVTVPFDSNGLTREEKCENIARVVLRKTEEEGRGYAGSKEEIAAAARHLAETVLGRRGTGDGADAIGQVVPGQVDALLSADGGDMWDPDVAETATIASLLVAHRVAGQRQETWRTREIADVVQRRVGQVTEDDVPDSVLGDVEAEVERRLQAEAV